MNRKLVGDWAARIVAAVVVVLLSLVIIGGLVRLVVAVWSFVL